MKKIRNSKGFTLIELLVVIAIIAVLAVVVILSLNPAELLRQARDSNRLSDLSTMKSAISLFQADVATSSVNALGIYGTYYLASISGATTTGANSVYASSSFAGGIWWGFQAASIATANVSTSRAVSGAGWIPINFNAISSGAPLGNLPVDPANNNTHYYVYVASSTLFKISGKMESTKFSFAGGSDVVSTDGGNSTTTFEQGTGLTNL